jgi:uncharacterized protein YkwD
MRHNTRVPRVVVMAAVLIAGLGSLGTPRSAAAWTGGAFSTADETAMLALINQARASASLPPLVMDSRLQSVAESRSADFVRQSYFGHSIPTGCGQVFSILQQQGIAYSWAAENIGWNTYPDDQATTWQFNWFMGSSTHKANILSSAATSVGIGAYKSDWTNGTACGQTGDGKTYTATKLYTLVFIQTPPPDTTGPTMTTPMSKLYTGTAGTSTLPVTTTWSATDPSGVKGMYLDRQTNSGAFTRILTATLATAFSESLADGTSYRYHAYATDTLGNVCSGAYGPTFKPSRVEQTSTAVTYAGSWSGTMASTSASGGSYRYASAAGASASYTSTGTSIGWVAIKSPAGGSASVYVDGVLKATISLYLASTAYRAIVVTYNWSSQGTHTVKIVAKGNGRIYLDAFVKLANA